MKSFIVFSALLAVALAHPGYLYAPQLAYAKLVPGAPIGHDGRVVDTPEVAHAKAAHAEAHIKEKNILAHEAAQSAEHIVSYESPVLASYVQPLTIAKIVPAAPIGHDGRVVDTPEVAHAKAEHAAAHIKEKIALAHEAAESAEHIVSYASPIYASHVEPLAYAKIVPGAPIGHDGRVVDTPEVAHAKAEHAAAHIKEKITLAHEAAESAEHIVSYASPIYASHVEPLAYAKIVPGAPIGHDGRVVDTPEVAHAKAEHAAAHLHEKLQQEKSAWEAPVVYTSYSHAPVYPKYLL